MFQQIYLLCRVAPRPCTPGILSYEKKVSKDSQGTKRFLDLQQKGESPLRFPQRRIELVKIFKGNDC